MQVFVAPCAAFNQEELLWAANAVLDRTAAACALLLDEDLGLLCSAGCDEASGHTSRGPAETKATALWAAAAACLTARRHVAAIATAGAPSAGELAARLGRAEGKEGFAIVPRPRGPSSFPSPTPTPAPSGFSSAEVEVLFASVPRACEAVALQRSGPKRIWVLGGAPQRLERERGWIGQIAAYTDLLTFKEDI